MRPSKEPEPALFACGVCNTLVPELQHVNTYPLAIPVTDFCSVCAEAIRHETERVRAAWKSGSAK